MNLREALRNAPEHRLPQRIAVAERSAGNRHSTRRSLSDSPGSIHFRIGALSRHTLPARLLRVAMGGRRGARRCCFFVVRAGSKAEHEQTGSQSQNEFHSDLPSYAHMAVVVSNWEYCRINADPLKLVRRPELRKRSTHANGRWATF